VHASVNDNMRRVHLLMVVCATLVSTSFIVGEHIAKQLDPAALTLVRFVLAVCFLLPIALYRTSLRISLGAFGRYALVSCSLVIFFWCMFSSLQYTCYIQHRFLSRYSVWSGQSGLFFAVRSPYSSVCNGIVVTYYFSRVALPWGFIPHSSRGCTVERKWR